MRERSRIGCRNESDSSFGKDRETACDLFCKAKAGYAFRSKVVHGRWKENDDSLRLMANAEMFVRKALSKILLDGELTKLFQGKSRESYLDQLVFQGYEFLSYRRNLGIPLTLEKHSENLPHLTNTLVRSAMHSSGGTDLQ